MDILISRGGSVAPPVALYVQDGRAICRMAEETEHGAGAPHVHEKGYRVGPNVQDIRS